MKISKEQMISLIRETIREVMQEQEERPPYNVFRSPHPSRGESTFPTTSAEEEAGMSLPPAGGMSDEPLDAITTPATAEEEAGMSLPPEGGYSELPPVQQASFIGDQPAPAEEPAAPRRRSSRPVEPAVATKEPAAPAAIAKEPAATAKAPAPAAAPVKAAPGKGDWEGGKVAAAAPEAGKVAAPAAGAPESGGLRGALGTGARAGRQQARQARRAGRQQARAIRQQGRDQRAGEAPLFEESAYDAGFVEDERVFNMLTEAFTRKK